VYVLIIKRVDDEEDEDGRWKKTDDHSTRID
jgi:hypothetical protein